MADATSDELRDEANLLITALMTDIHENGAGSRVSLEILEEVLADTEMCCYVIGALAGMSIGWMESFTEVKHGGDWAAAMAALREGVL